MIIRVIVVALIASLVALAGPDARGAQRSAVYGGSVGPLNSLLGPDAFFVTAEPSTRRLTGLGLTYIAACWGGSSTPVTLRVDRVVRASRLAVGTTPPANVLATDRNDDAGFSGIVIHPDAGGGRTEVHIDGRIDVRLLPEPCAQ